MYEYIDYLFYLSNERGKLVYKIEDKEEKENDEEIEDEGEFEDEGEIEDEDEIGKEEECIFGKDLFYKIQDFKKEEKENINEKIKIFGEEFVGNNGNKCRIIYRDKIFPLQSYFLIKDIDKKDKENKKFEIFLLDLEDIYDRSYMFHQCEALI